MATTKPYIVITGKNGQLGWELEQLLTGIYKDRFTFLITDIADLDMSKPETIATFFSKHTPDFFLNCAAYTAVDKAETEQELALTINTTSVGEMAKECAKINCKFVTISTDYVFNGNGTRPYKTTDPIDPVNYYGYTKWLSEKLTLENNPDAIIIRTSWVYSTHGNNFVKTMRRLMAEREEIKVVSDQVGSPTYAADLADALMQIVMAFVKEPSLNKKGIYHFSNEGIISWHKFAEAIKELSGLKCNVLPIPTSAYPTPAKRPFYSAMDKQKITADFNIKIKDWKESLQTCINRM